MSDSLTGRLGSSAFRPFIGSVSMSLTFEGKVSAFDILTKRWVDCGGPSEQSDEKYR
jgi:hypothetical protein